MWRSTYVFALALPLTASAIQGPHGGHRGCGDFAMHGGMGMGGGMMPPHLRGLDLTEGQRDTIFEIMHAQAPAMREKGKASEVASLSAPERLHAVALGQAYLAREAPQAEFWSIGLPGEDEAALRHFWRRSEADPVERRRLDPVTGSELGARRFAGDGRRAPLRAHALRAARGPGGHLDRRRRHRARPLASI